MIRSIKGFSRHRPWVLQFITLSFVLFYSTKAKDYNSIFYAPLSGIFSFNDLHHFFFLLLYCSPHKSNIQHYVTTEIFNAKNEKSFCIRVKAFLLFYFISTHTHKTLLAKAHDNYKITRQLNPYKSIVGPLPSLLRQPGNFHAKFTMNFLLSTPIDPTTIQILGHVTAKCVTRILAWIVKFFIFCVLTARGNFFFLLRSFSHESFVGVCMRFFL